MANEIIPYIEMCQREGVSLQRGMNYELDRNHSVILMSVRPGAPYADRFEDDGSTLVYEGHDLPRSSQHVDPKSFNQPGVRKWGQIFILDIAGRRRASMRLLLKQTESKVKDKDLTPIPNRVISNGSLNERFAGSSMAENNE